MIEWILAIGVCALGLSVLGVITACVLHEWRINIRTNAHNKGYGEGRDETERHIRNDAINRGLAFYHPQTGNFTWNPAQPKPELNVQPSTPKAKAKK